MSSKERTLILKIDDTQLKAAIKKMQSINQGGTSSSTNTSKPKGIEGLAKILTQNSGILKTVAKLTLILAAITILVKLITKITDRIVDSSPILQTMLKLLQTSITFILRPIGDFIGFFLRPFLIYFLRSVAIPMYKTWGPIMRSLGTFLGGFTLSNIILKYDPVTDPFFGTNGLFTFMGEKFKKWQTELSQLDLPLFNNVSIKFTEFIESLKSIKFPSFTSIVLGFQKFVDSIISFTLPILGDIAKFLPSIFRDIMKIFDKVMPIILPLIKQTVDQIMKLITSILPHTDSIAKIIEIVFIGITAFFTGINVIIKGITDLIRMVYPDFAKVNSNSGSTTNTTTNNFFGDVTSQEDYNKHFTFEGIVEKSLNSSLSGRG